MITIHANDDDCDSDTCNDSGNSSEKHWPKRCPKSKANVGRNWLIKVPRIDAAHIVAQKVKNF